MLDMLSCDKLPELLKSLVMVILIVCVSRLMCRQFVCKGVEGFANYPDGKAINPTPENLHEILTRDCKVEYCNAHNWSPNPVKLPCGYDVTNISTKQGCCIIPIELKRMMNETRSNKACHY